MKRRVRVIVRSHRCKAVLTWMLLRMLGKISPTEDTSAKITQRMHWFALKVLPRDANILRLKCMKFDFGWGSTRDSTGGAYSAPSEHQLNLKGPTSQRWSKGL